MARRYALVIGISEYQSPLKPLSKPASDAAAVAAVLEKGGDFQDVTVLKGTVTSARLIQALRTLLLEQATQNDVLLYFTGHGIPVVDPVVGKPRAYLATSDTAIALEGKQVIEARRAVSLDSLNDLIQESQLSSLVMLFDSCHSGDFLERSLVEKTFTSFSTRKDYYLITACRGFEQAYAIKREQHSIFTGALLAGLSQANANEDGQVTGDRLFESVARELRGSGQEPLRMGYGGLITLMNHQPQPTSLMAIVDAAGEPICPYQGLQAFTAEQQAFFFGRQRTVEDIRQRLEQQPFVPVIGASGSGKSSVVRAGLMPWLTATGWQILDPIKPGFDPLAALRAVFEPFFPRSNRDIQQLHQLIKTDLDPLPALVKRLSDATTTADQATPERFLLVVDQFEEVFTLCPDEGDRQRFIDLLTQVVNLPDARLAVVIIMRADFLEPCLRYPALHQLIETQAKYLASPTGVDLRDAIVEPATRQGYNVEERLLFKIQDDVGKEPGFLPLLEFALTKLWEQRDTEQKLLTLAQYENLGGLTGALNLHAEQVYHFRDFERDTPTEPRTEQEQAWIKRIFLRLVRTGEAEKDTRQRRPKPELLAIADADRDAQHLPRGLLEDDGGLVQGRLLVTGQEQANSVSWVDLAHEALLDGWTRFSEWRKGDREVRRLVDQVEDHFLEWLKNPENENLMMGGVLNQVQEQWLKLLPYLSPQAKEFSQRSINYKRLREEEGLEASNFIATFICSFNSSIKEANDQFLQILGYDRDELYNGAIHWKNITPNEYIYLDEYRLEEAKLRSACTPYEKELIRRDGSRASVKVGFTYRRESDDVFGLILDLTERKQLEMMLRQKEEMLKQEVEISAQANQERDQLLRREQAAREAAERANRIKDEFLAVLSHELRTPLNPILGWAKILKTGRLDEQMVQRAIQVIEDNAKLQVKLIDDLLDISRILRGKFILDIDQVELIAVIEAGIETVRLAAEAKEIQVQLIFASEIGLVLGDPDRLQQVIWNLLSNAIKFTPSGGRVEVILERSGENAQIKVKDNGKGISREFLPYIFDYFRQADSTTTRQLGGLGLGLAIVRQIVELHGGTVEAESPGEGQGTVFSVKLPLIRDSRLENNSEVEAGAFFGAEEGQKKFIGTMQKLLANTQSETDDDVQNLTSPQIDESSKLTGIRVLVVDDHSDTLEFLTFMLQQYGIQMAVAASVEEALSVLKQFRPHVLVSDISMPKEDGYTLIRQIRTLAIEQGGLTPAIAVTAYTKKADCQQAVAAGFQKHLPKPVNTDHLIAAIVELAELDE